MYVLPQQGEFQTITISEHKAQTEVQDEECACSGQAHDKDYRGDGAHQLVSECGHVTTKQARKVQSIPGDHMCTVITLKERNWGWQLTVCATGWKECGI